MNLTSRKLRVSSSLTLGRKRSMSSTEHLRVLSCNKVHSKIVVDIKK